ncbi:keratin-associated protein 4-3 [Lasius niger]|uniref:Keratin-associated protein 4-3 n=1 Tax=Lasius niger TaxID=67767 RepID=A0A0J7KYL6_LASNI|nr:keratin-associated protein 4-3 [Lasius niger]
MKKVDKMPTLTSLEQNSSSWASISLTAIVAMGLSSIQVSCSRAIHVCIVLLAKAICVPLLWCKLIWVNPTVAMPTLLKARLGVGLSPLRSLVTGREQAHCYLLKPIAQPEVLRPQFKSAGLRDAENEWQRRSFPSCQEPVPELTSLLQKIEALASLHPQSSQEELLISISISILIGRIPFGHVMIGHVVLDTFRLDTALLDTKLLDTARLDTARLDTARLDTARLDTARLDTARLDTARLDIA